MYNVLENLRVEGTIYRRDGATIQQQYYDAVKEYIIVEAEEKVIFQVPLDWDGFKNETASSMARSGMDVYFALAYLTSGDELVVDFEGRPIEAFNSMLDGVRIKKFVKRTLCVVRKINEKNTMFETEAFSLKVQYTEPLIRLMKLKCYGKDGLICAKNMSDMLHNLVSSGV